MAAGGEWEGKNEMMRNCWCWKITRHEDFFCGWHRRRKNIDSRHARLLFLWLRLQATVKNIRSNLGANKLIFDGNCYSRIMMGLFWVEHIFFAISLKSASIVLANWQCQGKCMNKVKRGIRKPHLMMIPKKEKKISWEYKSFENVKCQVLFLLLTEIRGVQRNLLKFQNALKNHRKLFMS